MTFNIFTAFFYTYCHAYLSFFVGREKCQNNFLLDCCFHFHTHTITFFNTQQGDKFAIRTI